MAPVPLHRTSSGAVLLGVCAGIARYFDVDPVLVRLLFLLLAIYSGLGIVAYLVLAVLMPSERTVGLSGPEVVRENLRELGETARRAGQEAADVVRERRLFQRRRQGAGLLLVALGGLLLLVNLGMLAWAQWSRLWPVVLVLAGVALLLGRRDGEGRRWR